MTARALSLALFSVVGPGFSQNGPASRPPNPTYSVAIYRHLDPNIYFAEAEARMNSATAVVGYRMPDLESLAAKAALENSDNKTALLYATEALNTAKRLEAERKRRGSAHPQRHSGIAEAIFYANFVLGRLAVLDGDFRSAEQYLIAAGQTAGGPVLNSYGPDLSLAVELLKHGEPQSRQAVLKFIEEIRVFWNIVPPPFDRWSQSIAAGKIPPDLETDRWLYK